jgi:hypothetical protein
MHTVELQPISAATIDRSAADENVTCIQNEQCWLHYAIDPGTAESPTHGSLLRAI